MVCCVYMYNMHVIVCAYVRVRVDVCVHACACVRACVHMSVCMFLVGEGHPPIPICMLCQKLVGNVFKFMTVLPAVL